MAKVISKDVECPWCGAQPGEPCTEGSFTSPYVRNLPMGYGHLARTIETTDHIGPSSDTPDSSPQGQ